MFSNHPNKGVNTMAGKEDRLALERLENLITGFGWQITNTQWLDEKTVVTAERKVTPNEETPPAGPD